MRVGLPGGELFDEYLPGEDHAYNLKDNGALEIKVRDGSRWDSFYKENRPKYKRVKIYSPTGWWWIDGIQ